MGTRLAAALLLATSALSSAAGAGAVTPARSVVAPLPILRLAASGRSIAFVADAPTRLQCAKIGLWNTRTARARFFDAREQCLEETSTGQGVWDVAVATRRVLWLTYAGGLHREWTLWTATATKPKPRQLRFVDRDVDAPAPIVIGPGTPAGIPYAVDRELVYLGDDGRAIFKTTLAAPVRALAAGRGRHGVRVAALLSNGEVVGLDARGRELLGTNVEGKVLALRVADEELAPFAVQVGNDVTFEGGSVHLPPGATMVDFDQGRVLWARSGDLDATTVTGRTTLLVEGSPSRPALGQLEPHGLAWARGRTVSWSSSALPR